MKAIIVALLALHMVGCSSSPLPPHHANVIYDRGADIAIPGECTFDNTAIAGDWVWVSEKTPGNCVDIGVSHEGQPYIGFIAEPPNCTPTNLCQMYVLIWAGDSLKVGGQ